MTWTRSAPAGGFSTRDRRGRAGSPRSSSRGRRAHNLLGLLSGAPPWRASAWDLTRAAGERAAAPSSVTLGALFEHVACVGDDWFSRCSVRFSAAADTSGPASENPHRVDSPVRTSWDHRTAAVYPYDQRMCTTFNKRVRTCLSPDIDSSSIPLRHHNAR